MTVIVNSCINKCEYIDQIYNFIINKELGLECLDEIKITLCDLLDVVETTSLTTTITNSITCSLNLTEVNTTCENIILTEV